MKKTSLLLRKFLHLKNAEQVLFVQAALLLVAVRAGLYVLPFRSLRRLAHWAARPVRGLWRQQHVAADQIAWAINVASDYIPGADTCLVRALAGQVLLGRYGFPAKVHIGVARGAHGLVEGHAWVESAGQVVLGGIATDLERYTLITGFEGNIL